jgi:hypothetical protein
VMKAMNGLGSCWANLIMLDCKEQIRGSHNNGPCRLFV